MKLNKREYDDDLIGRGFMWKIIDLEIPSPLSKPKASKRKLQEILNKREYDDDFIENVNVDILKGWDAAISIVKELISDEIHK